MPLADAPLPRLECFCVVSIFSSLPLSFTEKEFCVTKEQDTRCHRRSHVSRSTRHSSG